MSLKITTTSHPALTHRTQAYLRPFHRTRHTSEARKYRAPGFYRTAGAGAVVGNSTGAGARR